MSTTNTRPDKLAPALSQGPRSTNADTTHEEGIMTTHAPARPAARPIPSAFTGAGKLWLSTFRSHILNPWNMAFALAVPMFMYAMFGMTAIARTTQTGCGNVAGAMIVMMTAYGVILVGGSLGATLSVERTTGISRMYGLTPIQPWVILVVRLTALVALSAFITLITFSFGLATGAQMTPGAWVASAAVVIALSALGALIGLACGYTIKGENAYSASALVMVMGGFASGMFIPLEAMPPFISHIAPYTPLYGAVKAVYAVAGTNPMPTAAWINIGAWALIMAGIAWWGASHDTGR